jgi:hypothetical protein
MHLDTDRHASLEVTRCLDRVIAIPRSGGCNTSMEAEVHVDGFRAIPRSREVVTAIAWLRYLDRRTSIVRVRRELIPPRPTEVKAATRCPSWVGPHAETEAMPVPGADLATDSPPRRKLLRAHTALRSTRPLTRVRRRYVPHALQGSAQDESQALRSFQGEAQGEEHLASRPYLSAIQVIRRD